MQGIKSIEILRALPFATCKESHWNPKGRPLQHAKAFIKVLGNCPCKMQGFPLRSSGVPLMQGIQLKFLRDNPFKMQWIQLKSLGVPLATCNEFKNSSGASLTACYEFRWNSDGYPLKNARYFIGILRDPLQDARNSIEVLMNPMQNAMTPIGYRPLAKGTKFYWNPGGYGDLLGSWGPACVRVCVWCHGFGVWAKVTV